MNADTQRLINNIIRFAVVHEVDYQNKRVKVKDDAGWESEWLRFATTTAGKNKKWQPPTVGEQVMVFSPGGDLAQGVVSLSLYSDNNPANGDSDSATNWDITGDLNITATGNVKIIASRIDLNE